MSVIAPAHYTEDTMRIVAIEEHYVTQRLIDFNGDFGLPETIIDQLLDVGDGRLASMDAAGVDYQVLSALAPATQELPDAIAIPFAKQLNDGLKTEVIDVHPDRFGAFATLPMGAPEAAAEELHRTVTELGFVGALINGMVGQKFLDAEQFKPVLQAAQDLGVPIYLHPSVPPPPVKRVYYNNFDSPITQTLGLNGYGWHYETAMHMLRLILNGTLDEFPDLQWVIGHAGEGLPYQIGRLEDVHANNMADREKSTITEYLRSNVYATTSGYPFDDPFDLTRKLFGDDRVMFSVDYPFADNVRMAQWLHDLRLTPDLRERVASRTAMELLGLDQPTPAPAA
jgi:predicted TIM-barrel fold metal-dependent hydrolase